MTRAQFKRYIYLCLTEVMDVVGTAGGGVWLPARTPQGPILLPLRPDRASVRVGRGAVGRDASLNPVPHRLLHLVSMLAGWPGRQFVDSHAIIRTNYIVVS